MAPKRGPPWGPLKRPEKAPKNPRKGRVGEDGQNWALLLSHKGWRAKKLLISKKIAKSCFRAWFDPKHKKAFGLTVFLSGNVFFRATCHFQATINQAQSFPTFALLKNLPFAAFSAIKWDESCSVFYLRVALSNLEVKINSLDSTSRSSLLTWRSKELWFATSRFLKVTWRFSSILWIQPPGYF